MVSPRDLITWMFLLIDPQDPSDQMTKFVLKNTVSWKGHEKSKCSLLSHVHLCVTPWTVAYQTPLSMGILQAGILEW